MLSTIATGSVHALRSFFLFLQVNLYAASRKKYSLLLKWHPDKSRGQKILVNMKAVQKASLGEV